MAKSKEHSIMEAYEATFESQPSVSGAERKPTSGFMMELYEFTEDTNITTQKEGRILRPTSINQVNFIPGSKNKLGHIQLKDKKGKKAQEAKFWTKDYGELTHIKEVVNRGLTLKHEAILKPLACADNEQLLKLVVACTNFDLTLQDWLDKNSATAIPAGDYLSNQGKHIVRSGLRLIEYLWERGYICVELDKPSTYVMVGTTLKILPFYIRKRLATEGDDNMKVELRGKFADMLDNHIAALWNDPELQELTSLMRNPNASFDLIMGHPVLASPVERQVMYRSAYYPYMTEDQLTALREKASVDANWVQRVRNSSDLALTEIVKDGFDPDAVGALHFASVVSCHYITRRKNADPSWKGIIPRDHVDRLLKHSLPLLLCKRYALKIHAAFKSKVMYQL
ncbi:uncharacterized protein LOC120687668 isoform X2 [Panicum virgatum]|uniref:Uncharacterized protein n=1 Tax=Panicum virgatum TaxID=38727 RepID=A0A8T0MNR6_PANVG|nr:uncharacterized protein LOC120687668 isoform X2 [Panicum virgatum]KAG2536764.1 hypothetical protein PVAP13_9NG218700 [Panicum virgatum]